jgi:phosphatidate cytidylyltransferase
MSPSVALLSLVFWFYLALACGLLAVAGAVLTLLKWGLRKDVGHAGRAYAGWLLIVPVLLSVYFLGREVVMGFLTLAAALGFREFARATGLSDDRLLTSFAYIGIGVTGAACLVTDPADGALGWSGLFSALPALVTAAVVAVPIIHDRAGGQLRLLALAVFGFLYFGWLFGHLALLANSPHAYSYLGYLVAAVAVNDVAAYVFGKLLGRHPLRANVSPQKSWEGAGGALAVSCLLPWMLLFTFPHFGPRDCLVAGLIVGVGGPMGDLLVSVIKRDVGIKDMGGSIPGHGGILDRIDSLIYVAPLFFHYVRYRDALIPFS